MKCLFFAALLLFFSSCQPSDPHPELSDEIYKDLLAELDISTKSLVAEEKNLASLIKEKEAAIPQTGQIKFASKKVADSEEAVSVLRQQKQYFEIKIEERRAEALRLYRESLKPGGKPWPNPEEVAAYKAIAKFQRDKIEWQKNKGMKKDVPRGTEKKEEHSGHE